LNGGLVFLKVDDKEVVVHSKIYAHFGIDCIEKIKKNQTVLIGKSEEANKLTSEFSICEFLKRSA
jgi:hypothetical protein